MEKLLIFIIMAIPVFSLSGQGWYDEDSWDTIFFESPSPYIQIDTSENNLWQRAIPVKIEFDSAWSGDYAMITDSSGFYPVNNHSWFELILGSHNIRTYPYSIYIQFRHKYDTDTIRDGCYLTVSWDKGITWSNIIRDKNYPQETPRYENLNLYSEADTLFNGEYGFSGSSDGWKTTWFGWHYYPVKKQLSFLESDTMLLRFNFISDDTYDEREGWMVDDIRLFARLYSGIDELYEEIPVKVYPNPASSILNIEFKTEYQYIDVELFEISGRTYLRRNLKNKSKIKLFTGDIPPGVYILKIRLNECNKITRKVILR